MIVIVLRSFIFAIFLLLGSGLITPPKALAQQKEETIRLQLKWKHQFQFAGYYAAQIKGYYQEEGLHVELIQRDSDVNVIDRVLTGKAEFGIGVTDLLIARAQGKQPVVLASIFQHSPSAIMVRKDSDIRVPSDLVDRTVAMKGAASIAELQAMLRREGVPMDRIQMQTPSEARTANIINGDLDAMSGYVTNEPYIIESQGHEVSLIRPADYGIDFYGDSLFTSQTYIDNEPEIVQSFIRASLRGWEYAMENQEELIQYILTLPGVKERKTVEQLRYEAREMERLLLVGVIPVGHTNESRWERMGQVLYEEGVIDQPVSLRGFIYQPDANPALPLWGYLVIIITSSIGGIFFIVILWMLLIRRIVAAKTTELRNEIQGHMQTTKRLEEARVLAENANKAKSHFLANVSHEIRTPMTAILGFTQVIRLDSSDTNTLDERLSIIERNGEQLLTLINDILDLSKIEAGRMDVELIPMNLHHQMKDIYKVMLQRAIDKSIDLNLLIETEIPEWITSDPTRIRQIMINLIGNAIKFTEEGQVNIRVFFNDGMINFSVKDTGIGIPDENRDKLFKAFSQYDSSTTRQFGGTGLGLAISRKLAKLLGGDLSFTSQSGLGSDFILTIPPTLCEQDPDQQTSYSDDIKNIYKDQPNTDIEPRTLKVLVAEDGKDNQRLIMYHLNKLKFDIKLVDNGQAVYDAVLMADQDNASYDVILLDMQMPIKDGYDTARALRQYGSQCYIIAITAHAMTGDRERCIDAGCDEYLSKPLDWFKLVNILKSLQIKPANQIKESIS